MRILDPATVSPPVPLLFFHFPSPSLFLLLTSLSLSLFPFPFPHLRAQTETDDSCSPTTTHILVAALLSLVLLLHHSRSRSDFHFTPLSLPVPVSQSPVSSLAGSYSAPRLSFSPLHTRCLRSHLWADDLNRSSELLWFSRQRAALTHLWLWIDISSRLFGHVDGRCSCRCHAAASSVD